MFTTLLLLLLQLPASPAAFLADVFALPAPRAQADDDDFDEDDDDDDDDGGCDVGSGLRNSPSRASV